MKRLRPELKKQANYGDLATDFVGDFCTVDNGSQANFSNYMYYAPLGLHFPDFQNNYINRKDRTYGPSISRIWEFEELRDNPEWLMQDTR